MEKKISFGFSKVSKKPNILQNKLVNKDEANKIELIKGLEGQSIQLVTEKVEEAPLVIPLKDSRKTSAALLSLKTRQAVLNGEEIPVQKEQEPQPATNVDQPADDTIEKRAAKELLAEVNKTQDLDDPDSKLVLPVKSDELPLDGAKESTIDDYQSIPISQFGFAMLRGMGWKEVPKKELKSIDDGPIVRPKGMGLGADKALKPKALLIPPEANEVLEIKKGAFIKVLGGKHKDLYGQIEGLDDHAGRVIVKMALGGAKESFNEFMVQVVSKKEYTQYSKCINSAKYDEYKRKENAQGQIVIKKEEPVKREDSERERNNREDNNNRKYERGRRSPERNGSHQRSERPSRRSRSRERRDDYQCSGTSNKKYTDRSSPRRDRYKSSDSESSDSSSHRSKHKKSSKKKKSKKSRDQSHDRRRSASSSDEDRRYKKKTKKSKRGRSRSKCRR